MGVSSADEVAVDGTGRTAPGNGRSALRSIADLPGPPRLPLLGNAHQLARTSRLHLTGSPPVPAGIGDRGTRVAAETGGG